MVSPFKEPRRANPNPIARTTLAEATDTVKAEERARLDEHAARTALLRAARLAKVSDEIR